MEKVLIDWGSDQSYLFLNPKLPLTTQQIYKRAPLLKGHITLATSGTEGKAKLVYLSHEAFLRSAQAVNEAIGAVKNDVWLSALPRFHVGGLSIEARAYLSQSKVIFMQERWSPELFMHLANKATLTSLVPTQLYDLVNSGLKAPKNLRKVFIGGDRLSCPLAEKAISLGWPIVCTYGMSEVASQIALEEKAGEGLKIHNHMVCKINEEGYLQLKSHALLTCYGLFEDQTCHLVDPKSGAFFTTQDKAKIENGYINVLGRGSHFVKINGEIVSLLDVEQKVQNFLQSTDCIIEAVEDPRSGKSLQINYLPVLKGKIEGEIEIFNKTVMPVERILLIKEVSHIRKNSLGKIIRN